MGGDKEESARLLWLTRDGLGRFSSRNYLRAEVFAVAADDSEHKVRVVYESEFSDKKVTETVDVLLWPKAMVVLAYTVAKR